MLKGWYLMSNTKDPSALFLELKNIMKRLRDPGGCPWDRKQSYQTLRPYIIEEAYELVDAIDSGDKGAIVEEAGDLLLQVVFISTIAEEQGDFTVSEVIQAISEKLIRRHPHVFGDIEVNGSAEVLKNWERIKLQEKKDKKVEISILSGVPKGLPPLVKALRMQQKAASIGFDWLSGNQEPVFDKIEEELLEFRQAMEKEDVENMVEEIGDVLFSVVNLARRLNIDPGLALEQSNKKFKKRFGFIEKKVLESDKDWSDFSLNELDELWTCAKSML